jgi:putative peptidoglycan lipid II flippase
MQYYGFVGLAIALTIASMFNALMLLIMLQRRVGTFFQKALYKPVLKVIPACLLMGVAVSFLLNTVDWLQSGLLLNKSLALSAAVAVGAVIYLGCCYLLKVDEIQQGWQLLRNRGRN